MMVTIDIPDSVLPLVQEKAAKMGMSRAKALRAAIVNWAGTPQQLTVEEEDSWPREKMLGLCQDCNPSVAKALGIEVKHCHSGGKPAFEDKFTRAADKIVLDWYCVCKECGVEGTGAAGEQAAPAAHE